MRNKNQGHKWWHLIDFIANQNIWNITICQISLFREFDMCRNSTCVHHRFQEFLTMHKLSDWSLSKSLTFASNYEMFLNMIKIIFAINWNKLKCSVSSPQAGAESTPLHSRASCTERVARDWTQKNEVNEWGWLASPNSTQYKNFNT